MVFFGFAVDPDELGILRTSFNARSNARAHARAHARANAISSAFPNLSVY